MVRNQETDKIFDSMVHKHTSNYKQVIYVTDKNGVKHYYNGTVGQWVVKKNEAKIMNSPQVATIEAAMLESYGYTPKFEKA